MPQALSLFLTMALATQGLLWFHTNYGYFMYFSNTQYWTFDKDYFDYIESLEQYEHFGNTNYFDP